MTERQRYWLGMLSIAVLFLAFYALHSVLTPFLIAAFLAYLGDPWVNRLTKLKFSRTWAATIVFVVLMTLVLILLLFLVPLLVRQVTIFINRLPQMFTWIQQTVLPWISDHFDVTTSFDVQDLKTVIAKHWQQAGSVAANVWKIFSQSGLAILEWFAKLLLIPVVMFYLLRDWNQVVLGARELLPRRVEPQATKIARECDDVLGAFVRGQLLVMLSLSIIYSIGLSIVGLDLALLLGCIAGLLTIVPYLGMIVGVLAASIAALMQFHDTLHVVYVLIVFAVGHSLENMVLTPWLVGDRIGLHPVAVIFAVMVGGHLFGFMGVLLALPVAAMVMVLIRHLKHHYVRSEFYRP